MSGGAKTADKTKQVTKENKTGVSDMKACNGGPGGGEKGGRDVGYGRYERSRKLFGRLIIKVPSGLYLEINCIWRSIVSGDQLCLSSDVTKMIDIADVCVCLSVCLPVCLCVDRYGQYDEGAIAAAALFAAHPVHCEAVSSIVGRFRV